MLRSVQEEVPTPTRRQAPGALSTNHVFFLRKRCYYLTNFAIHRIMYFEIVLRRAGEIGFLGKALGVCTRD